jgi:hypothetical protein
MGLAHLDPNSTEDEIRWIGDRADEVVVTAEDPEETVTEKQLKALRIAGGKATAEEVPWDPVAENASVTIGGSLPFGTYKNVSGVETGIPARLTGSISFTVHGVDIDVAMSPGAAVPTGYIVITETVTIGEATENPSFSGDYQAGKGLFAGGEIATDLTGYVSFTGKFGVGFGSSGGVGKDLAFPIIDLHME